jgi:hypothetical protein
LDHGPLKARFDNDQLLRTHATIREIGNLVVILQSARQRADYLPPIRNVFSPDQVRELVDQARQAVDKIEALEPNERRTLAIALLFKDRQ